MRLARVQGHAQERGLPPFQNFVFGDDFFADGFGRDAHAGNRRVLFQVRRAYGVFFLGTTDDARKIDLFRAAVAEGGEKLPFRLGVLRKDKQSRGIAVQPMDKIRLSPLAERGKDRLGVDAALLIRHDHVPVLVDDGKRGAALLFGREEIAHDIPLFQGRIRRDARAVDADLARF